LGGPRPEYDRCYIGLDSRSSISGDAPTCVTLRREPGSLCTDPGETVGRGRHLGVMRRTISAVETAPVPRVMV
jgi:hypothetical protein